MADLIEILESFNRKERFFLLAQALGHYSDEGKPEFRLEEQFRQELSEKLNFEIPDSAFVAMDYHLDWLSASLFLFNTDNGKGAILRNLEPVEGKECAVIKGTQEDTDLLVAFHGTEDQKYHLVLVEAKAYSGWTNKQICSKAKRLNQIFGKSGNKYPEITPHFCLMGPRESRGLKTDYLPHWMKPDGKFTWLHMRLPSERHKVERCDQKGNKSEEGGHFHCPVVRSYSNNPSRA